jgi:hypothetical protein
LTRKVDEKVTSLLLAFWNRGIDTNNSCQEYKRVIFWIEFAGPRRLKKFMHILMDAIGKNCDLIDRIKDAMKPVVGNIR